MTYIFSKQLKPCMVCGQLTNQIEVCSEGYLCSDECNKKWYQDYDDYLKSVGMICLCDEFEIIERDVQFERICKSCGRILAIEKK